MYQRNSPLGHAMRAGAWAISQGGWVVTITALSLRPCQPKDKKVEACIQLVLLALHLHMSSNYLSQHYVSCVRTRIGKYQKKKSQNTSENVGPHDLQLTRGTGFFA